MIAATCVLKCRVTTDERSVQLFTSCVIRSLVGCQRATTDTLILQVELSAYV